MTASNALAVRNLLDSRRTRFCATTVAIAAVGYYVPQWMWGWTIPIDQVVVQGFIIGSLTALMAFGLALIYRSNKVINFAQADLGAVPASLAVSLVTLSTWSFWIAVPLALIASVALGSFVEFVIIRRFTKAPRLILMVVTIGLAQLLAGLGVAIPFLLGADFPPQQLPPPFDFSFEINPVIFHANDADRGHHDGRRDRSSSSCSCASRASASRCGPARRAPTAPSTARRQRRASRTTSRGSSPRSWRRSR